MASTNTNPKRMPESYREAARLTVSEAEEMERKFDKRERKQAQVNKMAKQQPPQKAQSKNDKKVRVPRPQKPLVGENVKRSLIKRFSGIFTRVADGLENLAGRKGQTDITTEMAQEFRDYGNNLMANITAGIGALAPKRGGGGGGASSIQNAISRIEKQLAALEKRFPVGSMRHTIEKESLELKLSRWKKAAANVPKPIAAQ